MVLCASTPSPESLDFPPKRADQLPRAAGICFLPGSGQRLDKFPRSRGNLRVWPGYIFLLSEISLVRALRTSENLRGIAVLTFPRCLRRYLAPKFPAMRICKFRYRKLVRPTRSTCCSIPLISVVLVITSKCCVPKEAFEGGVTRGVTGQRRVANRLGRKKAGLAY